MSDQERVVLSLACARDAVPAATHARGTFISSSQQAIRELGLEASYRKAIDPTWREPLNVVIAASWIPVEQALAHYGACERLGLERRVIHDIGRKAGRFVYSTTIAIVMRFSAQLGATPWAVFGNLDRFTDRTWIGSGFEVTQLAHKEAKIIWFGQPCSSVPYFREAFGAFLCGAVEPLCRQAYHRTLAPSAGESAAYQISWA